MPLEWITPSRLCDVARAQPGFADRIALTDGTLRLSYAQLDARIERQRVALDGLGLTRGDRIVLLLPPSAGFVAAYFAGHRAGLVVIPLNPLLGPDEVRRILSTMRPALVISATEPCAFPVMAMLDVMVEEPAIATRLLRIDAVSGQEPVRDSAPAIARDADDEALILFTSGTSGHPKGASHREGTLIANAHHSNAVIGIGLGDVILCPLPLSHVFGQIVLMLGGLMAGAELVLVARPSAGAVLAAMAERGATILAAVPTTLAALAEEGCRQPDAARAAGRDLRFVFAGGAPLPAATGAAFAAVFSTPVHQGYGMTEVACCIAIEGPDRAPSGGVGPICATLDHRIVPIGDTADEGELEIAGPNLLRGYYIDGALQPRAPEQWFPTGDVVRRDRDGAIFLFDRRKEMIIRNGYNVYPSEVEAALATHPAVLLAAVIGMDDGVVGQEIAAFVSLKDGATATAPELAGWCRARIALYKYPRLIAILPRLPTNATGKILKRALDPGFLQRVDML